MRRHWLAALLLVLLGLTGVGHGVTIHQKQKQLHATRHKIQVMKERVHIANLKERDLGEQLHRAQNQTRTVEQQLVATTHRIAVTTALLVKLKKDLARVKSQFAARQVALRGRMRDIYETDDPHYVNALLTAVNTTDFASRMDFLGMVVGEDERLLRLLRDLRARIEEKKAEITAAYRDLVALKQDQTAKEVRLRHIQQARVGLLDEIQSRRRQYTKAVYELEEQSQALEAQVQEMIRRRQEELARRRLLHPNSPSAQAGTGELSWPLSGPITSPFGWRYHPMLHANKFHTGIDIGARYGTAVHAADGGTVIHAGWLGGFGNAVIIDHGNGISTLYGHCSQLFVGEGQTVQKGDHIAAVGSTGRSTGPHLHFEVRQNGVPIAPMSMLR